MKELSLNEVQEVSGGRIREAYGLGANALGSWISNAYAFSAGAAALTTLGATSFGLVLGSAVQQNARMTHTEMREIGRRQIRYFSRFGYLGE